MTNFALHVWILKKVYETYFMIFLQIELGTILEELDDRLITVVYLKTVFHFFFALLSFCLQLRVWRKKKFFNYLTKYFASSTFLILMNSNVRKTINLKPRPCQLSAEYDIASVNWRAGIFHLLLLVLPILSLLLSCDWSKLITVISLA